MAGKGKKKKSKLKPKKNNGEKKEKKKVKRTGGRRLGGSGSRSAKGRCNVDIFSEAAMDNAYYTCHNVQDMLKIRGFHWPEAQKKKKKGKGKGKK